VLEMGEHVGRFPARAREAAARRGRTVAGRESGRGEGRKLVFLEAV
jgi:hypothetical protein